MSELIIKHPVMEIQNFEHELRFLLILLVGLVVHYYYIKFISIKKEKTINLNILKKLYLSVGVFFVILNFAIIGNQLIYLVEYKINNTEDINEYMVKVSGNNQGSYLVDNDDRKYHFISNSKEFYNNLRENYAGEFCYVKYYKWSRYVISIESKEWHYDCI